MKSYNYLAGLRLPDGGVPCCNDGEHVGYMTWIPGINVPIRRSRDSLQCGFRYCKLGDGAYYSTILLTYFYYYYEYLTTTLMRFLTSPGDGDEQIQLHLNYSANMVGHGHKDSLVFQLFAFGHYLCDDSEYCKNSIRGAAGGTAGHNTVVIDNESQSGPGDTPTAYGRGYGLNEGRPRLYEGRAPGLRVLSVDAAHAYIGIGCQRYERTMT
jgi:hypothetical protein